MSMLLQLLASTTTFIRGDSMKYKQLPIILICTLFFLCSTAINSFSAADNNHPFHTPIFGIWNVNARVDLADMAGSKLSRRMWRLNDYKLLEGQVLSQKLAANRYLKKTEVIGTMAGPLPAWIQPAMHISDKIYPPTDWQLFDKLIRRWLQDVPDFPDYFEVFNELDAHWTGSVAEYQRFESIIVKAIRDIYPNTKILGPGSYDADPIRLQKYMSPQFLKQFDGIVLHAYVNGTRPEDEFIGRIRQIKEYLKQIGFPNKPLYITEFGWTTANGSWQKPVNELTQAQYLSRAFLLLASERVEAAIYFCLYYDTNNLGERGFSILNRNMTPKPAYLAFKNLTHFLNDSNGISSGTKGTVFYVVIQKPNKTVLALWSPDGASSITLPQPKETFKVYDLVGKELTKSSTLEVDKSPVFIEFSSRLVDMNFK